MIIHCTRKLAAKLPQASATPQPEISPLGSWHANLYLIDRRQCVLFCHDATRYALFVPGLLKADFAALGRLHRELFLATLQAEGVAERQLKRIALLLGPPRFDTTTNQSVLGSLRILREELDSWVGRVSNVLLLDPLTISCELSDRPASIHGRWLWPKHAMLEFIDAAIREPA